MFRVISAAAMPILKGNKVSKSEGTGNEANSNKHIISESVVMLCTQNYQN